jgi:DNA-binding CsgD family transcriptional regulator
MAQKAAEREGRRPPVSFRTTEEMRDQLERAASASGRSITQEIEHRLEQSFREEDLLSRYFGSDEAIELLKELSLIINHQMIRSGRSWRDDHATREAIREHVFILFFDLDDEEGYARKKAAYDQFLERKKGIWRGSASSRSSGDTAPASGNMNLLSVIAELPSPERQVLEQLMTGATNKQIARVLGLDIAAVKVHLESILEKLKLKNLAEVANWSRQHLEPASNNHEREGEPPAERPRL